MALQKVDPLTEKLARLSRESEERMAERVAAASHIPYVDVSKAPISLDAVKLIPEVEAKEALIAAIQVKVKDIAIVAVDPQSPKVAEVVKDLEARKFKVKLFVGSKSGLEQAWRLYRFVTGEAKDITGKVEIEKQRLEDLVRRLTTFQLVQAEVEQLDFTKLITTKFLEVLLAGALANKASDIHCEAGDKEARIRYRLDGLLHDIYDHLPLHSYESFVSRIKLLSNLKINVHGEPQDGRFTIGLGKKEVEVRVSIIPSEFGETIVMRILDPEVINVELVRLGLRDDDFAMVKKALALPNGLLLNTGPTGSGKTTTLYAFLRQLNKPELKIITIEDPIEYHLPGIEQTQVDPEVHYTFASGLRAIVRQDPDVILVGEIRDLETAEIAMQSALTGHLVFSTLHTNDAVGAIPRLLELGMKPNIIGSALRLVIGQRLVRQLCKECRKPVALSAELEGKIKKFLAALPARVDRALYQKPTFYEPGGCNVCNHFGYKGRIGVFELLETGAEFELFILKPVSDASLKELARDHQMVTMQQDGVLKAIQGETTLAEVEEITGAIAW